MNRKALLALCGLTVLLGILGWYWFLVFSGHYDATIPAATLKHIKCSFPTELAVGDTASLVAIIALWRGKPWGFVAAFICIGTVLHACVYTIVLLLAGIVPSDLPHHLVLWPNLVAALVALRPLYREMVAAIARAASA